MINGYAALTSVRRLRYPACSKSQQDLGFSFMFSSGMITMHL